MIGLIIGIERERHRAKSPQAMGVRTFFLIGLLGAVAYGIQQPLIALSITMFLALAIVVAYYRTSSGQTPADEMGITTEIAAMVTFGLGFFAHEEPLLCLMLGVIMLFALLHKTMVHRIVAKEIKAVEVQSASILLLLAIGVIPLIPDRALDPWDIFNLHRFAVIISVIAAIQFLGYVASRVFGANIGVPFAGFFGGLVSSTAVFVSHANLAKERPKEYLPLASAALFSIVATLLLLITVVGAVSWTLIIAVSIPVGIIVLVTLGLALLLSWKGSADKASTEQRNPLNFWDAVKLGSLLIGLIIAMELTQRFLGGLSTKILTFLAALFELQGVVIASTNMFANQSISMKSAAETVLIAIVASMVSKIAITAFVGRGSYRLVMLAIIVGLTALSAGCWILVMLFPQILIEF